MSEWEETDQVMANRCKKERRFRAALDYFEKVGVSVYFHHQGLEVEDNFVFSPKSYKWRKVGKGKWYRSRGPKDFVDRFVRG